MANVTDTLAEGATRTVTRAKHQSDTSYTNISSGTLTIDGTYGQLVVNDDGTYSYTVTQIDTTVQQMGENDALTDTFLITLSEAGGAVTKTGDQQLDIIIDGTNDQPSGTVTISGTTTQGEELTANLSSLTDQEGVGTPSYQWQSSSDDGTSWGDISGATSTAYTLTQTEVDQLVRVTVSYTDNAGAAESVESSATTAVANANDAPVAVDDTGTAIEAGGVSNGTAGTAATGNVLTNDTDVDTSVNQSETKAVSAITHATTGSGTVGVALAGTYGSVTINADGSYSYSIDDANASVQALKSSTDTLTDTFTYTVADAGGLTDQGNLVVTIQGANDAPTLSTAISTQNLTTALTNNGWEFTFASDTFADLDSGDVLSYAATLADDSALPAWLSFDAATRTFSSSNVTVSTDISVKVTATDLANASISDTFTIDVEDVGDAVPTLTTPTAISLSDTAAEDSFTGQSGTLSGSLGGSGTGPIEYGIFGVTASGGSATKVGSFGTLVVTTADGSYTFTPNASEINGLSSDASESFLVTVTDTGNGYSASKQLTINLTAANDTPTLETLTAIDIADTTAQGDLTSAESGSLTADDRDADASLSYTLTGSSDNGDGTISTVGSYGTLTLTTATGAYLYQPNAGAVDMLDEGDSATDSFTLGVSDGTASTTQGLTVNLTGADDAPVITSAATGTVAENAATSTVAYTVTADDPDGDASLSYSLSGTDASAFSINSSNGEITLNSAADFETQSSYSINVGVSDDGGATTVSEAVVINVTDQNDAPTASGGTVTVAADTTYSFQISDFGFSDVDASSDTLQSVRIDTLPMVGTFILSGVAVLAGDEIAVADITAGNLAFITAADAAGAGYASFTYSVSDGTAYSATPATMTVNAGYSLTGSVTFWGDGSPMSGVGVTVSGQSGTSATDGSFALEAIVDEDGTVDVAATKSGIDLIDKSESGLTLTDVLSGLKLYLGKSLPESYSSPYNYIAADFDASGDISLTDVLNMLKYYLGKPTTNDVKPEWAFVDVADAATNASSLNKTSTTPHAIDQDISADETIELVGILRGDVDGSWEAPLG